ncbi:unnamed protein product [Cylindrotheca closterium]|uniref:RanBD1 domain-containing protein n=1 Tax=Cylindrotheca closterium TaxID=2856 RepID=A0AAD2JJ68_9STRA|nr:unnamed protein product [Cylindrotheca closterium]
MGETEEEKRIEEKKEDPAAQAKHDGEDDATKKKRTADRQITKDDGEDDDDSDDGDAKLSQPFKKASEEVLSKRKILKVKRPGTNGESKPNSSNPFAATKLTSSDAKAGDSGTKVFGGGSAFSGFGGFGSSTSGSSAGGAFGTAFGSKSGFGSASSSGGGFGAKAKASSSSDDDTSKPTTSLFGKPTGSTGFSFGFAKTSTTKDSESSPATSAAVTLPDNVKLTTGEEDEVKMHEARCKSFKMVAQIEANEATEERKESANPSVKPSSNFENKNQESSKSTDEKEGDETKGPQHRWQEVGTGPLKILRSTENGDRFRMVQRQESSKNGPAHKVILNAPLWKEAACTKLSEKQLRLTTPGSGESSTYTLKFKEAGEATAFSECIKDVCSEAKSCFDASDD